MGEFKAEGAVPDLIRLLSDPDSYVRMEAAGALRKIGSDDAVGPLIACLKEVSKPGTRLPKTEEIQVEVIWALEQITGASISDIHQPPLPLPGQRDSFMQVTVQKWLQWWEENNEKYQ